LNLGLGFCFVLFLDLGFVASLVFAEVFVGLIVPFGVFVVDAEEFDAEVVGFVVEVVDFVVDTVGFVVETVGFVVETVGFVVEVVGFVDGVDGAIEFVADVVLCMHWSIHLFLPP